MRKDDIEAIEIARPWIEPAPSRRVVRMRRDELETRARRGVDAADLEGSIGRGDVRLLGLFEPRGTARKVNARAGDRKAFHAVANDAADGASLAQTQDDRLGARSGAHRTSARVRRRGRGDRHNAGGEATQREPAGRTPRRPRAP